MLSNPRHKSPLRSVLFVEQSTRPALNWAPGPTLLSEISSVGHDAERGQRRGEADELTFSNIAGVLPCIDRARFERMLFRATRGNCYVRFSDITPKVDENSEISPEKSASTEKSVFIIFYKSQAIEGKIKKICDAFNCRRFDTIDLDHPSELMDKQCSSIS